MNIQSVCVFCGAASGVQVEYLELARVMGAAVADAGWTLVYGGGRVGLMGALADGALESGGNVVGVIPRHLQDRELQHKGLTECHVVESMHARKQDMVTRSDAFVMLPGGFGTLDEFFENLTWRQIGLQDKPIIILNHNGFWAPLLEMMQSLVGPGFIRPEHLGLFTVVTDVAGVIEALKNAQPAQFDPNAKWM